MGVAGCRRGGGRTRPPLTPTRSILAHPGPRSFHGPRPQPDVAPGGRGAGRWLLAGHEFVSRDVLEGGPAHPSRCDGEQLVGSPRGTAYGEDAVVQVLDLLVALRRECWQLAPGWLIARMWCLRSTTQGKGTGVIRTARSAHGVAHEVVFG